MRFSRSTFSKVNQGFRIQNQRYLQKFDNPQANPEVQIFTAEDFEEIDPEKRKYYCAICKSRLEYHRHLGIWICSECLEQYDPERLYNVPLRDTKDFILKPYMELQHNPTWDDDDSNLPFVEGVDMNKLDGDSESVRLENSTPDNRIQFIRVRGSPAKAIALMNEMDGK
jgi:hypothetical protein